MPGTEDLAANELAAAGAPVLEKLARFDRRDSLILFRAHDVRRVLRCGLVEDVFCVLADGPTPAARAAPKLIARRIQRGAFDRAMLEHHELRPKRGGRSFKVVARVAGRQPFRREEMEAACERAVGDLLPHWLPARGSAALEVWAHVIGPRTIVGLRLTGDELAQRRYKRAHLPASLKPTVARALVALSSPRAEDVFVDPMAGAGTILRERADAGGARSLAGGDIDPTALAAAAANVGRRAALIRWDAERLPLRTGIVDAIVTNPPYGRQQTAASGLGRVYVRMLREYARVLRSGGRCVVLTGEPGVLSRAVPLGLRVRAERRIVLRGLPVTAFVMVRQ